jgi:hypothetical protein
VEMAGLDGVAHHGPGAAGDHRHVLAAGNLTQDAGVAGGERGADIAGDGGDPQDVQPLGRREGEEEGDGVIDAGVTVDDQ